MKKRILNKKKKQSYINHLFNSDNGLSLVACKRLVDELDVSQVYVFSGNVPKRIKNKSIVYK